MTGTPSGAAGTLVTYLAERERVRDGSQRADVFDTLVGEQGRRAAKDRMLVRGEAATPDVAARLGLEDSVGVVVRVAYRVVDGRPAAIDTSYYPADIAAGTELESSDDIERGAIQVLAELGYPQSRLEGSPRARTVSGEEAAFFGCPPDSIAVETEHVAYTGSRAVRLTRAVSLGDRVLWRYDLAQS